jgi:hypothetical protein
MSSKGWRLASLGGTIISFEWADRAAGLGIQYLLESHPSSISTFPIAATYRLHSNRSRSGLTVFEDSSCIFSESDQASSLGILLGSMMHTWTVNCFGGLILHAALMSKRGKGLMIGGASGAGKSSLAAWLMGRGWTYHGDEQMYADATDGRWEGFARPVCLKDGWNDIFPDINSPVDQVTRVRGQNLVPAKLFGQTCMPAQAVSAGLMVFPVFQAESDVSLKRLSPAQAAIQLVHLTLNCKNLSNGGVGQAAKMARSFPAYQLSYGNFDQLLPFLDLIDSDNLTEQL